jgi:hypothetical protein
MITNTASRWRGADAVFFAEPFGSRRLDQGMNGSQHTGTQSERFGRQQGIGGGDQRGRRITEGRSVKVQGNRSIVVDRSLLFALLPG